MDFKQYWDDLNKKIFDANTNLGKFSITMKQIGAGGLIGGGFWSLDYVSRLAEGQKKFHEVTAEWIKDTKMFQAGGFALGKAIEQLAKVGAEGGKFNRGTSWVANLAKMNPARDFAQIAESLATNTTKIAGAFRLLGSVGSFALGGPGTALTALYYSYQIFVRQWIDESDRLQKSIERTNSTLKGFGQNLSDVGSMLRAATRFAQTGGSRQEFFDLAQQIGKYRVQEGSIPQILGLAQAAAGRGINRGEYLNKMAEHFAVLGITNPSTARGELYREQLAMGPYRQRKTLGSEYGRFSEEIGLPLGAMGEGIWKGFGESWDVLTRGYVGERRTPKRPYYDIPGSSIGAKISSPIFDTITENTRILNSAFQHFSNWIGAKQYDIGVRFNDPMNQTLGSRRELTAQGALLEQDLARSEKPLLEEEIKLEEMRKQKEAALLIREGKKAEQERSFARHNIAKILEMKRAGKGDNDELDKELKKHQDSITKDQLTKIKQYNDFQRNDMSYFNEVSKLDKNNQLFTEGQIRKQEELVKTKREKVDKVDKLAKIAKTVLDDSGDSIKDLSNMTGKQIEDYIEQTQIAFDKLELTRKTIQAFAQKRGKEPQELTPGEIRAATGKIGYSWEALLEERSGYMRDLTGMSADDHEAHQKMKEELSKLPEGSKERKKLEAELKKFEKDKYSPGIMVRGNDILERQMAAYVQGLIPEAKKLQEKEIVSSVATLRAEGVLSVEDQTKIEEYRTKSDSKLSRRQIQDLIQKRQAEAAIEMQDRETAYRPDFMALQGRQRELQLTTLLEEGLIDENKAKYIRWATSHETPWTRRAGELELQKITQDRQLRELELGTRVRQIQKSGEMGLGGLYATKAMQYGASVPGGLQEALRHPDEKVRQQAQQVLQTRVQALRQEVTFTVQYTQARMRIIENHYKDVIDREKLKLEAADRQMSPFINAFGKMFGLFQGVGQTMMGRYAGQDYWRQYGRGQRGLRESQEDRMMGMMGIEIPQQVRISRELRQMREEREDFDRQHRRQMESDRYQIGAVRGTFGQMAGRGISPAQLAQTEQGSGFLLQMFQQTQGAFSRAGINTIPAMMQMYQKQMDITTRRLELDLKEREAKTESFDRQISEIESRISDLPEGQDKKEAQTSLAQKYSEAKEYYASIGDTGRYNQAAAKYAEILKDQPRLLQEIHMTEKSIMNAQLEIQKKILETLVNNSKMATATMGKPGEKEGGGSGGRPGEGPKSGVPILDMSGGKWLGSSGYNEMGAIGGGGRSVNYGNGAEEMSLYDFNYEVSPKEETSPIVKRLRDFYNQKYETLHEPREETVQERFRDLDTGIYEYPTYQGATQSINQSDTSAQTQESAANLNLEAAKINLEAANKPITITINGLPGSGVGSYMT